MLAVEIAVQDAHGVEVAATVVPDRIELCTALAVGGLTPSIGFVESAVRLLRPAGVEVHVLIRPRAGGFDYSSEEVVTTLVDSIAALSAGADGVVIGGLRGGAVDLRLVRAVVRESVGKEVTFHRAFDAVSDPVAQAVALADAGVTRILTSGGRATAPAALDELAALVAGVQGSIQIMAGGSIRSEHVAVVAATGVDAVHGSAKGTVSYRSAVTLGTGAVTGEASYDSTDADEASRLVAAARAAVN